MWSHAPEMEQWVGRSSTYGGTKRKKTSSTAIAEKIIGVGKVKSLDGVNTRWTELETLYNEYYEVRGEAYGEIERKADILRVVPLSLQQRLQLEIEDINNEPIQTLLNKVQNYIRNMSTGVAKLDIGAVDDEAPTKKVMFEDKPQETAYGEEPQDEEEFNYMGPKGKGIKGKTIKGNCWLCGKPGHRAMDCKSKGKGNKGQDKKSGEGDGDAERVHKQMF